MKELKISYDRETNVNVFLVILGVLLQLGSCGSKGSGSRYVCEDCVEER